MELNQLLKKVVLESASYRNSWHFSFLLMYQTGCRHEETQSIYWKKISDYLLMLCPSKKSRQRFFSKEEIDENVYSVIADGLLDGFHVPRSTLSRAMRMLMYPYTVVGEGANDLLHLFRYNYIQSLVKEGLSIEQIQQRVGHVSIENTKGYVNQELKVVKYGK